MIPVRVILFDGVCNLCNGLVQFTINRDTKNIFSFGSLQSNGGQEILRSKGLPLDDFDSFVYVRDNEVFVKSTGALEVLKDLGGMWKLLYVFIVIPHPIRDYVYSLIASHRYSFFGKKESCMLPTPDLQSRFLK